MEHRNAPLTRTGRLRLVELVEVDGFTFEAAAAASNVSKATVHKWVWRWRAAGGEERASLECFAGRSSRPRRSPQLRSQADHNRVCAVRERTGWGPRLIATEVGIPHATVSRILRRRGCSRRPRPDRGDGFRHEWPCPGDLLQMDVKRFARFSSPGHALTGDRSRSGAHKRERVGYEFAHSVIDDHSRVAFTELHQDERGETVSAFFERALSFFRALGVKPRRVQTDNHFSYVKNTSLARLLAAEAISHHTIKPRTPRHNGKVERYQQTLKREWGLGQRYRSSDHGARALPPWLEHYNQRRRHSAIGNRPPITRVRNVLRQDN